MAGNRGENGGAGLYDELASMPFLCVLRCRLDGAILDANEAFFQSLGYTRDDLRRGLSWVEITPPEFAAMDAEAVKLLRTDGSCPPFEKEYLAKDGHRVPVMILPRLTSSEICIAIALDLTELRQAQRSLAVETTALRESEARFRAIARQSHQLLYDCDMRTHRILWFGAIEELTGYKPEEFPARTIEEWGALIHPDDRERALEEFAVSKHTGRDYDARYRLRHKSGRYLFVEDRGGFLPEPGANHRMLGIMADVTARRRVEDALVQSQKLESLGLLAGGIAHDFNNLLTAMMVNVNLAQAEVDAASEVGTYLENVQDSIKNATGLTRQVLAYSGRGQFSVGPADLSEIVEKMAKLIAVALPHHVKLELSLAAGLPSVMVDATQMQQVIMNLLTNAADAIGEQADKKGTIRISTVRTDILPHDNRGRTATLRLRPGPHVVLEVADSGAGMSDETRTRVFDPFFTTKPKGHGLGLSALLGILRGHDAGLDIESELGVGTTFRLYFPAHDDTSAADTTPGNVSSWSPARGAVLVADDDEAVRRAARAVLVAAGFEVIEAKDGAEAVNAFREQRKEIALVVLDVRMPVKDGATACREILAIDRGARVLLMSGFSEVAGRELLEQSGADGFLPKPFHLDELVASVRRLVTSTGRAS